MRRPTSSAFWFRLVTAAALLSAPGASHAADVPAAMPVMAGGTAQSPAETAGQNVLALNTAMFGLYGDSSKPFRDTVLARHPVILAPFSRSC